MIELKDKHYSLKINDHKIIVLDGNNAQKILYKLALLSNDINYEYLYNNELIDNKTIQKLRRGEFGFLPQTSLLNENLTIYENIVHFGKFAHNYTFILDILVYLKRFDLDFIINPSKTYPKHLSSAGLKFTSLACLLAKKPKYIFIDEPEANLNEINTHNLAKHLKTLKEKGITIIMASDNELMHEIADEIYIINDAKFEASKNVKSDNTIKYEEPKREYSYGIKDLLKYALLNSRGGLLKILLLSILIVIASIFISNITLKIILVLLLSFFYVCNNNRRKEFAILKANGLSNGELTLIVVFESLIQGLEILFISLIASLILVSILSLLFTTSYTLSLKVIIELIITSFSFVLIPTLISILIISRVQPDAILRN